MESSKKPSIPLNKLASMLRKLRGKPVKELAQHMNMAAPNLSAWLGTRPQVLNETNQMKACQYLGWRLGQLISSQVHLWRINSKEDFQSLKVILSLILEEGRDRLVICPAYFENAHIGSLLVIARKGGTGTLIRVRRATNEDLRKQLSPDALGFGEWSDYHRVETAEFDLFWQDETSAITTPEVYFERFKPAYDCLASAMDWDSQAWRIPTAEEVKAQHELMTEASDDRTDETPSDEPISNAEADYLADLAKHDDLWIDLGRRFSAAGLSPQDVEACVRERIPHFK